MGKVVGIHQPNYLPYLGFFDKMAKSDIFVLYDDAQFTRDFQHRNRIKTAQGASWLTVPVERAAIPINRIKIKNDAEIKGVSWQQLHLNKIQSGYKKSPFFGKYYYDLYNLLSGNYTTLAELNITLIKYLMKRMHLNTRLVLSSELGYDTRSSQKLADITSALGGEVYLSGAGGKNYMDEKVFERQGIQVQYQDFKCPVYPQRFGQFIPNMSVIDYLFNAGGNRDPSSLYDSEL